MDRTVGRDPSHVNASAYHLPKMILEPSLLLSIEEGLGHCAFIFYLTIT